MKFAERTTRVEVSPTMQVAFEAARLKRQGVDVADLGAGEPDFSTPPHVKAAGIDAIRQNFTKYTVNAGIPELREAICARYAIDYGVQFDPSVVIVTAGGKQALFNIAFALFGAGDEVITHSPGWPTIVEQIKLTGAEPVIVRTQPEDGFTVRAEPILDALTPRTRAIIINSPGNPTGALVTEEDLATIAKAAATRGLWVILDLCYEHLIYDEIAHNLPHVLQDELGDQAVLVGTLSKSHAMTGWRCGWAIGTGKLISACNTVQSHMTSNVASVTQRAAVAALTGSQDCVAEMRREYRVRRDQLLDWLGSDSRIHCTRPAGAFYLFPDITELLSPDGLRTSAEFSAALLSHAHVALTAGEAFDAPGFLRVSYATSLERLQEGVKRLGEFIRAVDAGEIVTTQDPSQAGY